MGKAVIARKERSFAVGKETIQEVSGRLLDGFVPHHDDFRDCVAFGPRFRR